MLDTDNLFKNRLGGRILFDIFIKIPLNEEGGILHSFRHFPRGTSRVHVLLWFETQFDIDFMQYLINNLSITGGD